MHGDVLRLVARKGDREALLLGARPDVGAKLGRGAAAEEGVAALAEPCREVGLGGRHVGVIVAGSFPVDDRAQLVGERRLGGFAGSSRSKRRIQSRPYARSASQTHGSGASGAIAAVKSPRVGSGSRSAWARTEASRSAVTADSSHVGGLAIVALVGVILSTRAFRSYQRSA